MFPNNLREIFKNIFHAIMKIDWGHYHTFSRLDYIFIFFHRAVNFWLFHAGPNPSFWLFPEAELWTQMAQTGKLQ